MRAPLYPPEMFMSPFKLLAIQALMAILLRQHLLYRGIYVVSEIASEGPGAFEIG